MKTLSIQSNVDLRTLAYYQIGGKAQHYAEPSSFSEIAFALRWAQEKQLPIAIIGSSSNSFFADGTISALVISLRNLHHWRWETDDVLFAEAGVSNTEVAEACLEAGKQGASWMYRMPGLLGGTVRMNARCYGGEISQIVTEVLTIDCAGNLKTHAADDVFFGYKNTKLMQTPEVVIAARFRFPSSGQRKEILKHMQDCEQNRHEKHHFDLPSCGSTFKNNYAVGRPSGQIFDELSYKGVRSGGVQVSPFHANFIFNTGRGTASDLTSLTAKMRSDALIHKHADLELEVQPIGVFSQDVFEACAMERLGPFIPSKSGYATGFLWHPSQTALAKLFPHALLESGYEHLFRKPQEHSQGITLHVAQLCSLKVAQSNPTRPFVRWRTRLTDEASHKFSLTPSAPAGAFVDELWNFSVSELFIAEGLSTGSRYYEFEMTPKGHWIAIEFSGTRRRTPRSQCVAESLWTGTERHVTATEFGMDFSYALLEPLIHNGTLRVLAALSLGSERYHICPSWHGAFNERVWVEQQPPSEKADFHRLDRFWTIYLQ